MYQCNGETPCKECSATHAYARRWYLGCRRGDIKDDIKGKIPGKSPHRHQSQQLTAQDLALGTGEWFLPRDDETQYRIRISHDTLDPNLIIRDCEYLAGKVTSSTQSEVAILDFVKQFYDVDARWSGTYTKKEFEFLKKCAGLQANIVSKGSCKPSEVSSRMLIALSLRCLVLTQELALVGEYFEYCDDEKSLVDEVPVKYKGLHGSILDISRLHTLDQDEGHTRDRIKGKSISQSLEELLQLTQNLMMRRKPQDWPMLLCTLCLLSMISYNCWRLSDSAYCRDANSFEKYLESFGAVYFTLCSLFGVTSKTLHPLCKNWNEEAYSRLVGGNDVLVGTFQWMHDRWLERAYIPPMKCP